MSEVENFFFPRTVELFSAKNFRRYNAKVHEFMSILRGYKFVDRRIAENISKIYQGNSSKVDLGQIFQNLQKNFFFNNFDYYQPEPFLSGRGARIFRGEKGKILTTRFGKFVFTSHGQLATTLGRNFIPILAHYKSEDYLPTIKVKNAIVLNSEHLDSNYFHLLTEYIPVFEHLLKSNFNLSEFVIPLFLRGKKHPPKFVFEFFKLYGIPSRNIIFNEKPFILNADLIYSGITLLAKSRACFKQFSNRVLEGKVDGEKNTKLVICRENCGRTILNFQEFFPNFRRVFLERLSIREQAKLFNGSDEIVAAHGAGLTNLIFCQPGTVVTEFRTPQIANRKAYKRLAQSFKLNYKTEIAISENKKSTPTADMRLRPKREIHFAIDTDYDVDNTMAKTKHWTYGSRQIQSDIVILKRDTVFRSKIDKKIFSASLKYFPDFNVVCYLGEEKINLKFWNGASQYFPKSNSRYTSSELLLSLSTVLKNESSIEKLYQLANDCFYQNIVGAVFILCDRILQDAKIEYRIFSNISLIYLLAVFREFDAEMSKVILKKVLHTFFSQRGRCWEYWSAIGSFHYKFSEGLKYEKFFNRAKKELFKSKSNLKYLPSYMRGIDTWNRDFKESKLEENFRISVFNGDKKLLHYRSCDGRYFNKFKYKYLGFRKNKEETQILSRVSVTNLENKSDIVLRKTFAEKLEFRKVDTQKMNDSRTFFICLRFFEIARVLRKHRGPVLVTDFDCKLKLDSVQDFVSRYSEFDVIGYFGVGKNKRVLPWRNQSRCILFNYTEGSFKFINSLEQYLINGFNQPKRKINGIDRNAVGYALDLHEKELVIGTFDRQELIVK